MLLFAIAMRVRCALCECAARVAARRAMSSCVLNSICGSVVSMRMSANEGRQNAKHKTPRCHILICVCLAVLRARKRSIHHHHRSEWHFVRPPSYPEHEWCSVSVVMHAVIQGGNGWVIKLENTLNCVTNMITRMRNSEFKHISFLA